MSNEVSGRSLLLRLGVGNYNATMMIPYLFVSPMTTDPKSPMIILMVKRLQGLLNQMGAGIAVTGYLDQPTANALSQMAGSSDWHAWSWSDVITAVLSANARGISLAKVTTPYPIAATGNVDLGPISLPDVPGGIFTYAAGAFLLWRLMSKKGAARV